MKLVIATAFAAVMMSTGSAFACGCAVEKCMKTAKNDTDKAACEAKKDESCTCTGKEMKTCGCKAKKG